MNHQTPNNMIRLAFFSSFFYPHKGGVEKYVQEMGEQLTKRGVIVDVITLQTNSTPREETWNGMCIYRLDCWNILRGTYPIPKPNLTNIRIMRRLVKRNYTVVATQTRFFPLSFAGLLWAKLHAIPVIHTEHGTRHAPGDSLITNTISWLYDHTIGTMVIRWANIILTICDAGGKFVLHLGARNYEVVYNGIATDRFKRSTNSTLRQQLNLPTDEKIITFIGRLIKAKGVQDILTTRAHWQMPGVTFLIVGKGNYLNELKALAKNDPKVIFMGEKNEGEIIDILSNTDIFVNPSYAEGLPTSILEAGACECAVIATDVGGTDEIIMDQQNGFLIKPGSHQEICDRISQLLNDQKKAKRYAAEIRKRIVEKFDWKIGAQKLYEILEKV